jgi:hypothetical protein
MDEKFLGKKVCHDVFAGVGNWIRSDGAFLIPSLRNADCRIYLVQSMKSSCSFATPDNSARADSIWMPTCSKNKFGPVFGMRIAKLHQV